jgi:starvation-inducible DNA-binding protein
MANQSATLTKEKPRATHEAPTDLSREGVAAITAALRHLLADSFALYLKTKNFHWHMTGRHFRDYHLLLVTPAAESVCGDCGRSRRMKS